MEYDELLEKICHELDIRLTHLSDSWLKVLEKNGDIHYIQGYKFDLNNHGIGNIMDDKGLFHDLLVFKKLPVIEHKGIFKTYNKQDVLNYFNKNNNTLIVKGNLGTCGKEVYLVNNEKDLFEKIDRLLLKQSGISLCPYYDIQNEYRVIVLNNEARVIYGKIRPEVIGDGKSTIFELATAFNSYYINKKEEIVNSSYIPENGEHVLLNFQFNLSNGAKMFLDIEKELKEKIVEIALDVAKKVGIVFGSIDIIYTNDKKLYVIEANSGVMMDSFIKQNKKNGYEIAYNLYKDAIKLMFEKK